MLSALERVQSDLVRAIYMKNPVQCATLDMDATLRETMKKQVLGSLFEPTERGVYLTENDFPMRPANFSTRWGSNCVPAHFLSSVRASPGDIAGRWGRPVVIAS